MIKPEEKLEVTAEDLQGDTIDINIPNGEMFKPLEKRMCNFCNTDTHTQDEDCVDCGFSKTYGSRK